ncbi:fimbria/pilus periplasmic chaperone [Proteus sp. G2618]|uniref:fimbrial biogenesis chaperone n=1 Tax=Proteus sp. G2618 TaxID=2698841 RepID=UPI0013776D19|nr:molecular chaperone [Proteus sp. G2618]NBN72599.1 fimbria/pilus periplasmic chaperone [Proteus sp. G2618]
MFKKFKFFVLFFIFPTYSQSSIEINKDKFIFIESINQETIEINNKTNSDYFIQSWITHYDKENNNEIPFMITPPLIKMEKDETFSLKILKNDKIKEENRETLYRINIKRIPILSNSDNNKNMLHVSLNSVYNLIYRPLSIEKDAKYAYKKIEFLKNKNNEFIINNPTPYFITLSSISCDDVLTINESKTIPPFKKYNTKKEILINGVVKWKIFNQYGLEIEAVDKEVINDY